MDRFEDDLPTILQYQLIPTWERYGLERLAISAPTLHGFQKQPLPSALTVSGKRRKSRKVHLSGARPYNNVALRIEAFPADAQDTCRHPILYCVLGGQADLHIADYVAHCPAGHFVLMRPGVSQPDGSRAHLEDGNRAGHCEILHFSLLPGAAGISSWICYSKDERHWSQHHCLILQPNIVQQFHFFMSELLDQPEEYRKTAYNSLHNVLLLTLRELQAGRLEPQLGSEQRQALAIERNPMGFALQYIKTHLHEPLTIAKVAEATFMSRSSFQRQFTGATKQSFNQYLTLLRLEKARELLAANMSVQSVSECIGIKPAQLYRICKNHLGVAPTELQQARRMKQND